MGELNEKVNYEEAADNIVNWLAEYLYKNYEPYPPMQVDTWDSEPWESAGKRMRERWHSEAQKMLTEFGNLFKD